MIDVVQTTALVVSGLLLVIVLELVRRTKLTEEYLVHLDRVRHGRSSWPRSRGGSSTAWPCRSASTIPRRRCCWS